MYVKNIKKHEIQLLEFLKFILKKEIYENFEKKNFDRKKFIPTNLVRNFVTVTVLGKI